MRIIQLIQKPQLRGAEIFACQLSNHLVEQGHEVLVVTIFKGNSQLPFKGEIIDLERPLSKRFVDFEGWRNFNRVIKKFQPDIIQANASDTLKFAVSSKLVFSCKIPIIFRNASKMGDFINSKLKLGLNKFYLSKVSFVISVSKECEKDFIKTFNFQKNRIKTIEIGVEDQKIGTIPKDLDSIYKKGPVLSHIGGFVPEKNHNGLINIFKKTINKFPNAQLLLMGKGNLESEIKLKTEELKIQDSVHFLGYRNDVLEILHHSDAFILPSYIEGLPGVILESMYCKTPVVAYNVGGIGEVVVQGKTGWLVEKNDELTFHNYIEEVLTDKSELQKRVISAKEMVSEKFMNEQIAKKFSLCYDYVLNN